MTATCTKLSCEFRTINNLKDLSIRYTGLPEYLEIGYYLISNSFQFVMYLM